MIDEKSKSDIEAEYVASRGNKALFMLTMSIWLSCFLFANYILYDTFHSDEAIVVAMPPSPGTQAFIDLNGPLNSSKTVHKNLIVRYLRDLFVLMSPRMGKDAKAFFTVFRNFSTKGGFAYRYTSAVLKNIENEVTAIDGGDFLRIYQSGLPGALRISGNNDGRIIVEIDLIVIHAGQTEYRYTPSCKLEIVVGERTVKNAYGLYLEYIECFQLIDATTGEKKEVALLGPRSDK